MQKKTTLGQILLFIKNRLLAKSLVARLMFYLTVSFTLIFIVVKYIAFYGLPFTHTKGLITTIQEEKIHEFNLLADINKEQITNYFSEKKNDLYLFSKIIKFMIDDSMLVMHSHKQECDKLILQRMQDFIEKNDFERGYLIDITNNKMITKINDDTNLPLEKRFNFYPQLKANHGIFISRVQHRYDKSILYLCNTIDIEKKNSKPKRLALVMQLDLNVILKEIVERTMSIGKSADFVLVNQESLLLHPTLIKSTASEYYKPFVSKINALPAQLAAKGEEGAIMAKDYRNEEVLAAFRYIPLGDNWGWGLVLKIDKSELFHDLYHELILSISLWLISLITILSVTYILLKKSLRPLTSLCQATSQIAAGNFNYQLETTYDDEMDILVKAFKKMAKDLYLYHTQLESLVIERTNQLQDANKALNQKITEKEKAEQNAIESQERFKTVMDSIDALVYVASIESHELLYLNKFGQELFGECIGKKCWAVLQANQEGPCDFCSNDKLLDKNGNPAGVYIWDFQNTVTNRWFECHDQAIKWIDGSIVRLEIASDVTERKALQDRLRHSEKMDAIRQLAGGIAHDFNNVLTAIINTAELIKNNLNDKNKLLKFSDSILKVSMHASQIVRQLLTFTRNETTHLEPINLHESLRETIDILKHTLNKKITVHQEFNAHLSVVEGDRSQFQNLFINLAVNASDAMPDGGILTFQSEIIELEKSSPLLSDRNIVPGSFLKVTVADTGKGIPVDVISRIFEPFFTTKSKDKGTGMGLATVYAIMDNINGFIEIETQIGTGTKFLLFFPLLKKESIEDKAEETTETISHHYNILFLDDEEIICESISILLSQMGHQIVTFTAPGDAVRYYQSNHNSIDIVILDYMMPKMNGKEVFEKLKAINPGVKALIASGDFSENLEKEMIEIGFVGFVSKPYASKSIINKISQAIL